MQDDIKVAATVEEQKELLKNAGYHDTVINGCFSTEDRGPAELPPQRATEPTEGQVVPRPRNKN